MNRRKIIIKVAVLILVHFASVGYTAVLLSLPASASLLFYDDFDAWSSDTEDFYSDGFFGSGCGTGFNNFHHDPGPVATTVTTNGTSGSFSCNATGSLVNGWHYSGNFNGDPAEWTVGYSPSSSISYPGMPAPDAITAFGLDLRIDSPSMSLRLSFYDSAQPSSPIASVDLVVDQPGDEIFFGWVSQSPIDNYFTLESADGGFAFDNIRLGTATASAFEVSAPATLTLFSIGLAGLGWSRRKTSTVSK